MKFDQLPGELYLAILEWIDNSPAVRNRASSTLALSRALPRSPVLQRWLYDHIIISHPQNLLLLYQNLNRKHAARNLSNSNSSSSSCSVEASWIRIIEFQLFTLDGQIVADLLRLIPDLQELVLNVGTTYSPEHLDEIFQIPRLRLVSLRVVFRPYVQKATYYTFLKGAYFDSCIEYLASWPAHSQLKGLSIIQEHPPERPSSESRSFAQPIVFFSLEPFARLSGSPILRNLLHLRIQIPGRDIARYFCPATTVDIHSDNNSLNPPTSVNKLQFFDITGTLFDSKSLPKLLMRFYDLRHLVFDECSLPRNTEGFGGLSRLGTLCATVNLKKAQQREKLLKEVAKARREAIQRAHEEKLAQTRQFQTRAVRESQQTQQAPPLLKTKTPTPTAPPPLPPKSKKGRRSVAVPTFSIREKPTPPVLVQNLNQSQNQVNINTIVAATPEGTPPAILDQIRILPTVIPLRSICMSTLSPIEQEENEQIQQMDPLELIRRRQFVEAWIKEFNQGWVEGIKQLESTRQQLYRLKKEKHIRLFRFRDARDHQTDENIRLEKAGEQLEERLQNLEISESETTLREPRQSQTQTQSQIQSQSQSQTPPRMQNRLQPQQPELEGLIEVDEDSDLNIEEPSKSSEPEPPLGAPGDDRIYMTLERNPPLICFGGWNTSWFDHTDGCAHELKFLI